MCGLCKLNAAALDTTVACGYNGIDQHNLGLLPPLRGLIFRFAVLRKSVYLLPPIAGIDIRFALRKYIAIAIAPIAGIDTALRKG